MSQSVADFMAQPSLKHEPRPEPDESPVRYVTEEEFTAHYFRWGSHMELCAGRPRVVTADGGRYELEQVPA